MCVPTSALLLHCFFRGQRRLSLRFLAWYFLNIDMQSQLVEGHDSVEDALTALKVGPSV